MYATSDLFLDSVRRSSKRKTTVDVYYGTDLTPLMEDIPVVTGSLSIDRSSDLRMSGNITVASDTLDIDSFLPTGIEIRIKSGFVYPTGVRELIPMGVFRVEDISFSEGSNKNLSMSFYDRGKALQDIESLVDVNLSGWTYQQALDFMVGYAFEQTGFAPTCTIDTDIPNWAGKLPGGTILQTTHLEVVKKIAEAIGGEQYFDRSGNLQIGVIPSISTETLTTEADWDIDVGDFGVLISANRKTTRSNTYNGVAVYGANRDEGTNDRVFAGAFDFDSNSPTNYNGSFGRRTKKFENELLITTNACTQAATQLLKDYQGLAKNISFTSLWNPALDVGDKVLFTFLDGTQEIHLVDSLSFNFNSGEMSGETRTVQYITN